jgi:putative membrane protein
MKSITLIKSLIAMVIVLFAVACEPKKEKEEDSTEIAKEANDEAIDDRDEEKDADFIVNTIGSNYCEVKLAKLALTRSNDPGIKEMAKGLEADHSKIITDLKGYAAKNGISVPLEESEEDKKDINDLAEESDVNKFDEKWCNMLKNKHEKTINKFESRLNKSEDMDLKNWINETLPTIKGHLEMLKQHEARLK